MRAVLDADPRALMAFAKAGGIGTYHKDVPLAAFCAAGIVGTMAEDCGPCTQLVIDMAQREGVVHSLPFGPAIAHEVGPRVVVGFLLQQPVRHDQRKDRSAFTRVGPRADPSRGRSPAA